MFFPHLGQVRLADAGGPAEQEGRHGAVRRPQAGAGALQRPRCSRNRLLLANDLSLHMPGRYGVWVGRAGMQRAGLAFQLSTRPQLSQRAVDR